VLETENVRLRKRFNDQKSEMDRQVKVYEARIAEYTKQISKLEKEKEDLTDNTLELEKKILQN
jgi:predicted RNase H-like nuclease (RuvC/YqgF family)